MMAYLHDDLAATIVAESERTHSDGAFRKIAPRAMPLRNDNFEEYHLAIHSLS